MLKQSYRQNQRVSAEHQQFLYLTTTGRKTGKPHKIEIWFVARDGKYYLVSEHQDRSHWVQNLKDDPKISFTVGKDTYRGRGRMIDRKNESELAAKITALMNAKYKWSEGLIVELAPARS
ncbi:MAG: nitroreductase family deazaflavin-dependent oxidoreductase [Thaumarchaeota archaeon]|nr:MAG: nitroreductase family deazaflavin-dependent oxidoreductase [Nitrososphaerota archaeon]